MIKVLYVISQLGVGGAERQLMYLISNLDPQVYKIVVCSFSDYSPISSRLRSLGAEVVIIHRKMKPDLTRFFSLYRLIKEYRPDLIHSYLFVANTWARIVGKLMNIPVILSERNSMPHKPLYMNVINRLLYSFGNCVIANSFSGAQRVIQNKEFKPERVFVVHNGLPLERFQKHVNIYNNKKLREDIGISEKKRVIGIIGRLTPQKNHTFFFDCFKLLHKQIPDTCVLCIGGGSYRKKLQSYTVQLGIDDSVIFAGQREDIPECLSLMDVLVLPSKWEGLPNVILEAMAAQCLVIATDVGGVGEMVIDGVTGFLVKLNDKSDMMTKILISMSDHELTLKIKTNAHKFVEDNFNIKKMVLETEQIYMMLHNSSN